MNAVREKVKAHKPLTQPDKELLDIIAFYQNIASYQAPEKYAGLFNQTLTQPNIESISQITSSEKIINSGGLALIHSELGIYTKEETIAYLNTISQIIIATYGEGSTARVALSLSSKNHGISLIFDMEKKRWVWMDVNHWPPRECSTDKLADFLFFSLSFYSEMYSAPLVFNTQIVTVQHDPMRLPLIEQFSKIKKVQPLSTDFAERNRVEEMVWLAAIHNFSGLINTLAKKKININLPLEDGRTPAALAVEYNNTDTLLALKKQGVDLNTPIQRIITLDGKKLRIPLYLPHIAAEVGHAQLIDLLAKEKVNLLAILPEGSTAVHMAAKGGHAKVIDTLAKHGVPLNTKNILGQTPAMLAVIKGHHEVIAAFAKHRVNLNWPELIVLARSSHQEHLISILEELKNTSSTKINFRHDRFPPNGAKISFGEYRKELGSLFGMRDVTQDIQEAMTITSSLITTSLATSSIPIPIYPQRKKEKPKLTCEEQIDAIKKVIHYNFFAPFRDNNRDLVSNIKEDILSHAVAPLTVPIAQGKII